MFLNVLEQQANDRPELTALQGESGIWSWQRYHEDVITTATRLRSLNIKRLALELDNGPEWAIIDLACLSAGIVIVPLPSFFSETQKEWVRSSASIDAQIGGKSLKGWLSHEFPFGRLQIRKLTAQTALPPGTAKITFTSGTTGEPKGVCLSQSGMFWTAQTLADALNAIRPERHLVSLPLSILLENLCGIYIPLLLGAQTVILSSASTGFEGSSQFNPGNFLQALMRWRPQSLVLVPEILRVLLHLHQTVPDSTRSLSFVAVGGGKVPAPLMEMATHTGLPVFEGYGLSECGSVVALNLPGATKKNSVGRPLPGIRVSVDHLQQLSVMSPANALGYLGEEPQKADVITGDLATVDEEGFIHILGRLKNVQINAYGRNFSPEWPEAEAMACPAVRRVVIFGDGLRRNVALVDAFEGQQDLAREQLMGVCAHLPDYAQFHRLLFTSEISSPEMITANGRRKRSAIWQSLKENILTCSEEEDA
ncbi:AMP-binding protein [Lelliottia amnigena]|uniref:AMP-binding protein n=1 Tax=Lelliottia amnigena TaxID=61646 RepID=UPI001F32071A|nr:AMP-binding protein [Lelliottia amnigena]MCE9966573.1 AMP-binding protein [Lelliottia amnigena]